MVGVGGTESVAGATITERRMRIMASTPEGSAAKAELVDLYSVPRVYLDYEFSTGLGSATTRCVGVCVVIVSAATGEIEASRNDGVVVGTKVGVRVKRAAYLGMYVEYFVGHDF
jgi:hypothetical protein